MLSIAHSTIYEMVFTGVLGKNNEDAMARLTTVRKQKQELLP